MAEAHAGAAWMDAAAKERALAAAYGQPAPWRRSDTSELLAWRLDGPPHHFHAEARGPHVYGTVTVAAWEAALPPPLQSARETILREAQLARGGGASCASERRRPVTAGAGGGGSGGGHGGRGGGWNASVVITPPAERTRRECTDVYLAALEFVGDIASAIAAEAAWAHRVEMVLEQCAARARVQRLQVWRAAMARSERERVASVRIQCTVRGRRGRQRAHARRRVMHAAAGAVASAAARVASDEAAHVLASNAAATQIQRMARGSLGRLEARAMRRRAAVEAAAAAAALSAFSAAVRIQSAARGLLARKRVSALRERAVAQVAAAAAAAAAAAVACDESKPMPVRHIHALMALEGNTAAPPAAAADVTAALVALRHDATAGSAAQAALGSPRAVAAVVAAAEAAPASVDVRAAALATLAAIEASHAGNKSTVLASGGLALAVASARELPDSLDVARGACGVMRSTSYGGAAPIRALVDAGGIAVLLGCLATHGRGAPDVAVAALGALGQIGGTTGEHGALIRGGVPAALVRVLADGGSDAAVTAAALSAAVALALSDEGECALVAAGALEWTIAALGRHAESKPDLLRALRLLRNLSGHEEHRARICTRGGLRAIVTTATAQAADAEVVAAALGALRNVAVGAAQARAAVEAGAPRVIGAALRAHAGAAAVVREALAACKALAPDRAARGALEDAGVTAALLPSIAALGDPALARDAAVLLDRRHRK
jgi:hypothetical protein